LKKTVHSIFLTGSLLLFQYASLAQKGVKPPPPPVYTDANRQLAYTPDSLGNRVPDFSYCGYAAGERAIPDVPVKIVVPVTSGDATSRIQSAIDYVSSLPADKTGIRGAVLLQAGIYHVNGSLKFTASGVVLRGSGAGTNGTILSGDSKDRETLITIRGKEDITLGTQVSITNEYVPVNANNLQVAGPHAFKVGDAVMITRPSTKEWIATLGTDHFGGGITALGWKPGQRDLQWFRNIVSVNGNAIVLDAPVTTALEKQYGGATIAAYTWPGRISNTGIENLQLVSAYDDGNPKDEDHRWMAITIDQAQDVWVRQVSFKHFAGSAVAVYERAARITVEDCKSLEPISEIGGERRNTFFTAGQQTLFQRCYAEYGIHDFATGFCAAGPNAFVQCESHLPYSFSGGIDSWSAGVLFDVVYVDGQAISFMNRGQDGQGAGWNIANSVLWNCSASRIDCYKPPTANNWAFGAWSQFAGDGYWGESNNSIQPRSLYYGQLQQRIGAAAKDRVQVMPMETEASSSPTVDVATQLTKQSVAPAKTLLTFIDEAAQRQPIPTNAQGVKTIDELNIKQTTAALPAMAALHIEQGVLVRGTQLVAGYKTEVPWWTGSARPYGAVKAKGAVTRFVPGRTGEGLTDDLDALTDSMKYNRTVSLEQNYGLWYERRRDDHERIRRMDGDVWAPFYELPFARSGKETAWDGLSKYDLTKYNYWYWSRLQQFATLADRKGLVLVNHHYFQHNIIEAGAHYADFPWRPANNINNTGFPEPPPYAGDKRIFMAEQFYDTSHPVRRALHKAFIRKNLESFANNNSVVHLISAEFTGPLHFVQFWLDEIAAWERETGKHPIIGLSTTKDVQDAILADPKRAAVVDMIDIRYWHYQQDGTAYAPQGGQNLAPRQHARLLKPKASAEAAVYKAVSEYRQQYPGKAVTYYGDSYDRYGWAVLMAGGSMPSLAVQDPGFLQAVGAMRPLVSKEAMVRQWILQNAQTGYVIYDLAKDKGTVEATIEAGSYSVNWVNGLSGAVRATKETVKGGKAIVATKPDRGNWILWLKKNK
jgi:hypothetical protein